jgi:hypothetical protein
MITYLMYTTGRRYNYEKIIYISATFFCLALVLNINTSSAAAVNQTTNSTIIGITTDGSASNNYSDPNTTINTHNTSVSTNKPDLNYTMVAGAPVVKNKVVVNGLTLVQLKDWISRVQAFYVKYGRLPGYVSYGTRKIPMATFKKNLATQGLTIKTTTSYSVANPDTSSVAALAKFLAAGSTSTS